MYHILLSLIAIGAPLDCDHASELIDSARNNPDKSEQLEIVRVVIAHTEVSSMIPTETKESRLTRSI